MAGILVWALALAMRLTVGEVEWIMKPVAVLPRCTHSNSPSWQITMQHIYDGYEQQDIFNLKSGLQIQSWKFRNLLIFKLQKVSI